MAFNVTVPTLKELKALSTEDLKAKLAELRLNLAQAKFQHALSQLEKTSTIKDLRKCIARALTLLKQHELQAKTTD